MRTKKLFLLICLGLFSVAARSQVIISLLFGDKLNSEKLSFGLLIGNSWNDLTGYKKSDLISNFNLGLYLNLKMGDKFSLQFDAMAKYKLGAKGMPVYSLHDEALDSLFAAGNVERGIKYLSLITTAQYRVFNYVNLELGPQISLRTKAMDIFSVQRAGGDLKFEKNISDQATRFDIGVIAGLSYQIQGNGVKIGVRYYWGLIDIFPSDPGVNENRSIQISGYVPVGRKKALAKKHQTETQNHQ